MATMITRFLGAPCSSYFDDFFAVGPESISRDMLAACLRFNRLIGMVMKDSESKRGRSIGYPGAQITAPGGAPESPLILSISPKKRTSYESKIRELLDKGRFRRS